jgi:hypothetical protein
MFKSLFSKIKSLFAKKPIKKTSSAKDLEKIVLNKYSENVKSNIGYREFSRVSPILSKLKFNIDAAKKSLPEEERDSVYGVLIDSNPYVFKFAKEATKAELMPEFSFKKDLEEENKQLFDDEYVNLNLQENLMYFTNKELQEKYDINIAYGSTFDHETSLDIIQKIRSAADDLEILTNNYKK